MDKVSRENVIAHRLPGRIKHSGYIVFFVVFITVWKKESPRGVAMCCHYHNLIIATKLYTLCTAQPGVWNKAAVEVRDFWCDPPVDSVDSGTRDTRRSSRHPTARIFHAQESRRMDTTDRYTG